MKRSPKPIRQEIIERWKRPIVIMSSPRRFEHWALVIRSVFEFETLLSEALSRFFVTRNPALSHKRAANDLYDYRKGVLNSLTKMIEVAFYVAVIDEPMRHDLKQFAQLRNLYAHNPKRGQLENDTKAFEKVTGTHLYKASREALRGLDEQQVLLCIADEIRERLRELP